MSDHVNTPPPLLTRFYPYIPKGVENAVLKALEKYPDARFQTVEEFGAALEHPSDFTYGRQPILATPGATPGAATTAEVEPVRAAKPARTPAPQGAQLATIQAPIPVPAPNPLAAVLATPRGKITAAGVVLLVILAAAALALRSNKTATASMPATQAQSPVGQTPLEQRLANSGSPPALSGGASSSAPATVPRTPVAFNVVHDHGGAFARGGGPSCWGRVRVVGTNLEYHVVGTNDGRRDEFLTPLVGIQEVQANAAPIRNQQAFHIVVNGQLFNFLPQGMSGMRAADMIQGAIQGR
jgi:hypothetical protein